MASGYTIIGTGPTAPVTVTPVAVNHPPVATPQSVVTPQDTPVAVTLAGTDADGDSVDVRGRVGSEPRVVVGVGREPDLHAGAGLLRSGLVHVHGERRAGDVGSGHRVDHGDAGGGEPSAGGDAAVGGHAAGHAGGGDAGRHRC